MLHYAPRDEGLFQRWFFHFSLLKCHQQAGRQNNSDTIIWFPGFCTLYWTTYTTFTVVLRLSCPFIRLTNLSKASRTMSIMSETLTEVTAHSRAQLSPVNHCQNDKKPFWGQRAMERDEPSHSDCWLANPVTLVQLWAILPLLLEHLSLSGCVLWCILRIPNSSECFGSQDESWSAIVFDVRAKCLKRYFDTRQLKTNACLWKSGNQNENQIQINKAEKIFRYKN